MIKTINTNLLSVIFQCLFIRSIC